MAEVLTGIRSRMRFLGVSEVNPPALRFGRAPDTGAKYIQRSTKMSARTCYILILCLCTVGYDCEKKGNPFLEKTGEIIFKDSLDRSYRGLFMLVPAEYQRTIEAVKKTISSEYGIEKEVEDMSLMSKSRSPELSDDFESEKRDRAEVERMGFCLDTVRQCTITSKRFNVIPSLSGFSELKVLVIDGRPILKENYSFLAIKRNNDYWWWGREYHTGCPVPFKVNSSNDVITYTEMRQLQRICDRLSVAVPKYFNSVTLTFAIVDPGIMKAIKQYLEQLEKGKR
jgi:hypothetical protein